MNYHYKVSVNEVRRSCAKRAEGVSSGSVCNAAEVLRACFSDLMKKEKQKLKKTQNDEDDDKNNNKKQKHNEKWMPQFRVINCLKYDRTFLKFKLTEIDN